MSYTATGLGFTCPAPLVWNAAYRRCMNADDPRLVTGGMPVANQPDPRAPISSTSEVLATAAAQGVPFSQVELSDGARSYLAQRGFSVDCKIGPAYAGPQGGDPQRLCSIGGGPYEHAAYALNLNPSIALPEALRGPVAGNNVSSSSYSEQPAYTPPAQQQQPQQPTPYSPTPATPSDQPSPASPTPYSTLPELPAVLTETWIDGVPNWALAAVAGFAAWKALS